MAAFVRSLFIFGLIAAVCGVIFLFWRAENQLPAMSYNEFLETLENREVAEVYFKGGEITLVDAFDRKFSTFSPDVQRLIPILIEKNVIIKGESEQVSALWYFFCGAIPLILIVVAWYSLAKKQASQDDSSDFAKGKEIHFTKKSKQVTFRDVAGVMEVKEELVEIIDFLQKPKKYSRLGAIIPHGILFQGPPGTGKTLLARAIAGEAGVPFFSISGSDFVEMFVGVGASRVRDLFKEAKKNTPCIIFIDEIDAVGGHRSSGAGAGGQDERGQTLNALLVEMDGFDTDDTIIVIAATNRPDILDPALLRPGRFDRQITVLPPDVKGRHKILEVHAKRVPMGPDVKLEKIARSTPGFTGAELANLINESALIAGRAGKKQIDTGDIESAKDRVLMGVERKGLVISEKDRKTMAYHEAGHAILAKILPEADPLHKITIIPRGKAMGHTQQLAHADRHAYSMEYLQSRITILMGGRVAEEIALQQKTTGAEADFQQAVAIATKMVCKWGMDEELGPMSYVRDDGGFLGGQVVHSEHSEETARQIDRRVRTMVENCYRDASEILNREKDFLEQLANVLLQNETLDSEEMDIILGCVLRSRKEALEASSS